MVCTFCLPKGRIPRTPFAPHCGGLNQKNIPHQAKRHSSLRSALPDNKCDGGMYKCNHYVYNQSGYTMSRQPEVSFVAYDDEGNVMLVDYYTYPSA